MLCSMRAFLLCALCLASAALQQSRGARSILSEGNDSGDDDGNSSGDDSGNDSGGDSSGDDDGGAATSSQLSTGSGGRCAPSSLSNYQCMVADIVNGVSVHYNPVQSGDTAAQMAVSMEGSGWVAMGFPTSPNTMAGATAVIATTSAPGDVGVYSLNGYAVSQVQLQSGGGGGSGRRLQQGSVANSISNLAASSSNGMTVAEFERALDSNFDGTSSFDVIVAMSPDSSLARHSATGGTSLALTDAADTATPVGGSASNLDKERWAHGWLEVLGWGVLIPLGIISHSLKPVGGFWLRLHQAFNITGLVAVLAGTILAFVELGDALTSAGEASAEAHKVCGILAFALLLLMPFSGFLRPKPRKEDGSKGGLRIVWELAHRGIGYIALIIALVAIFTGLHWIRQFGSITSTKWRDAYIGVLCFLFVLWLIAKLSSCLCCRGRSKGGAAKGEDSSHDTSGHSSSEHGKPAAGGGLADSLRAASADVDYDGAPRPSPRPVPRGAVV